MKKFLFIAVFALVTTSSFAQMTKENDYGINKLKLEFRTDFDCFSHDDAISSGFTGKYLNFIIAGDITDNLYYAYRQRINKIQKEYNFFDATDYLFLGWRITKNISWTAGKEVVAMGGVEYDLAPIDVYFHSNFWDNFNCYRFGTNLEFTTNNQKNIFTLQFTNSPFDNNVVYGSLYNYSIHWRANYKHFGPVCSVNMYEYKKGAFLNVIALGTNFYFGPVVGYLDFTNRAHGDQEQFLFKDFTTIARVGVYLMQNKMQVFVKGGCDVNKAQEYTIPYSQIYDICVLPGTDILFYGGGFEYYPLQGKNDIRVHAFFAVSDVRKSMGTKTVIDPIITQNENGFPSITYNEETVLSNTANNQISYQFNIGLTWRLNYIDK